MTITDTTNIGPLTHDDAMELAAAREGGLATVRSLARRERQPDAIRAL